MGPRPANDQSHESTVLQGSLTPTPSFVTDSPVFTVAEDTCACARARLCVRDGKYHFVEIKTPDLVSSITIKRPVSRCAFYSNI